ncbi:hypothetical protein SAMN06264855_13713, partial [Halorubrum vacuolatum]
MRSQHAIYDREQRIRSGSNIHGQPLDELVLSLLSSAFAGVFCGY